MVNRLFGGSNRRTVQTELYNTKPRLQFGPKIKTLRYNDVTTSYPPSPIHSNEIGSSKFYPNGRDGRTRSLFVWRKKRPNLILALTYICVLAMGVAIGFVPFISKYVGACERDRITVDDMAKYFKAEANRTFRNWQMMTQNPEKSSRFNRWVVMEMLKKLSELEQQAVIRKGFGLGNNLIPLTCQEGNINVTGGEHGGIFAGPETLGLLNEYCKQNVLQSGSTKRCAVSLQKVYKRNYGENSLTTIEYVCSTQQKQKKESNERKGFGFYAKNKRMRTQQSV